MYQFASFTQPFVAQVYSAPMGALSRPLDATFLARSDAKGRGILERFGGGVATQSKLAGPSGLAGSGSKRHVGVVECAGLVETETMDRMRAVERTR